MKIIRIAIAVLLMIDCSGISSADSEVVLQRSIASGASAHDAGALLLLTHRVQNASRTTRTMYDLALYYAEPSRFKERFIDSFPVDNQGVMHVMYIATRLLGISRWYPYDALAHLAVTGDRASIRKLMLALAVADGGAAELLGDGLGRAVQVHPNTVLRQLDGLPLSQQKKLLNDSYPWCSGGKGAVSRMTPEGPSQRSVKDALEKAATHCA